MNSDSHRPMHRRRSIRLKGYNYRQPGAYFVTICTKDRACVFGDITDGQMMLNAWGRIVSDCWRDIPNHFRHVQLDASVVMPNHFHGVLFIVDNSDPTVGATVGARHVVPQPNGQPNIQPNAQRNARPDTQRNTQPDAIPIAEPTRPTERFGKPVPGSIPTIVRSFKSAVTKDINEMRGTSGETLWQRNYYEHVVRNQESLNRIRQYITTNPQRWHMDKENPQRRQRDEFDVWFDSLVGADHFKSPKNQHDIRTNRFVQRKTRT